MQNTQCVTYLMCKKNTQCVKYCLYAHSKAPSHFIQCAFCINLLASRVGELSLHLMDIQYGRKKKKEVSHNKSTQALRTLTDMIVMTGTNSVVLGSHLNFEKQTSLDEALRLETTARRKLQKIALLLLLPHLQPLKWNINVLHLTAYMKKQETNSGSDLADSNM